MLDLDKVPFAVKNACLERGLSLAEIAKLTPQEAFNEYCNWNGFINYGDQLWTYVHALAKAERKPIKD